MEPQSSSKDHFSSKQTRRRAVLVCSLCHKNKLKCDRQRPCSSCKARGNEPDCAYASDVKRRDPDRDDALALQQPGLLANVINQPLRRDAQSIPQKRPLASDTELRQRLDKVESLLFAVKSDQAQQREHNYPTPQAKAEDRQSLNSINGGTYHYPTSSSALGVGALQRLGNDSRYSGDTAFASILEEVSL